MRLVNYSGSIEEQMKFPSAPASRRQSTLCITGAVVSYETRSLFIGLILKATLVVSIWKLNGSNSNPVSFWGARGEIPSSTERLGRESVRVGALFPVYERLFHWILFPLFCVQSAESVVRIEQGWNEIIYFAHSSK